MHEAVPPADVKATWDVSKIVAVLCIIFVPFFILSSGTPARELTLSCVLLLLGFLAGLKARSYWTALDSVLLAAVVMTLALALIYGVRLSIVFDKKLDALQSLLGMTAFGLIVLLQMALGLAAGLFVRRLRA